MRLTIEQLDTLLVEEDHDKMFFGMVGTITEALETSADMVGFITGNDDAYACNQLWNTMRENGIEETLVADDEFGTRLHLGKIGGMPALASYESGLISIFFKLDDALDIMMRPEIN